MNNFKELLNNLGVEGWIITIIMTLLLSVSLLVSVSKALINAYKYIIQKFRTYKSKKDLSPYFSSLDVITAQDNYIETYYQNVPPSQDQEPSRSYASAAKNKLIPLFINEVFDDDDNDQQYFIIMADSGMGKTTFMMNLYLRYKYNFFKNRKYDIKIFPLGQPNVLSDVKKIRDEDKYDTILLLDAFDEDNLAIENYEQRLSEIIDCTWMFKKIIITCRTQFFPDSNSEPLETGLLGFGPNPKRVSFKKLYISVFSEKDITKYLKKKFNILYFIPTKKYGAAKELVTLTPKLVVRPMLLSHIELLVTSGKKFKFSHELYSEMINKWLDREAKKPGIFTTKTNLYQKKLFAFSKSLAKEMYLSRNKDKLSYMIHGYNLRDKTIRIDPEVEEILTIQEQSSRSLLNRNATGYYKFSHKSIFEYFLALNVLDSETFRKKFKFDKDLDACKNFIIQMLNNVPNYNKEFKQLYNESYEEYFDKKDVLSFIIPVKDGIGDIKYRIKLVKSKIEGLNNRLKLMYAFIILFIGSLAYLLTIDGIIDKFFNYPDNTWVGISAFLMPILQSIMLIYFASRYRKRLKSYIVSLEELKIELNNSVTSS